MLDLINHIHTVQGKKSQREGDMSTQRPGGGSPDTPYPPTGALPKPGLRYPWTDMDTFLRSGIGVAVAVAVDGKGEVLPTVVLPNDNEPNVAGVPLPPKAPAGVTAGELEPNVLLLVMDRVLGDDRDNGPPMPPPIPPPNGIFPPNLALSFSLCT